jgi:hypothetical protein
VTPDKVKYIIIIAGIVALAICAWRYSSLSRHCVSTQGTVLRLRPSEHQSFDYLYSASGVTHFGTATAQTLGRDLASIKVGEHLTVFYDAQHPDDSTADPPILRGIMSVFGFVFGGAFFSLGVILWHQTRSIKKIEESKHTA